MAAPDASLSKRLGGTSGGERKRDAKDRRKARMNGKKEKRQKEQTKRMKEGRIFQRKEESGRVKQKAKNWQKQIIYIWDHKESQATEAYVPSQVKETQVGVRVQRGRRQLIGR